MSSKNISPQAIGLWVSINILINAIVIREAFLGSDSLYWLLLITVPLLLFSTSKILKLNNMNNQLNPVVLPESDFRILKRLASGQAVKQPDDMSLNHEVERAIIVKDDAFPQNTIRINTRVSITDMETEQTSSFTIVLPEHADIRKKKISVVAPMGAALIGFREGDDFSWKMPGGIRRFRVLEVDNSSNQ